LGYNIETSFAMMQLLQITLQACESDKVMADSAEINKDRIISIGCDSALLALTIADIIVSTIQSLMLYGPMSIAFGSNAAAGVAMATALTIGVGYQDAARYQNEDKVNKLNNLFEASKNVSDAFGKVGGTILAVYNDVVDPKKDFNKKADTCRFVEQELLSVDDGKPFNQFVIDVLQILMGETMTNEDTVTALNSLKEGLTSFAS
jgi:hypothetical protein